MDYLWNWKKNLDTGNATRKAKVDYAARLLNNQLTPAAENGMDSNFYDGLKVFAKKLSEKLFSAFDSAGWYVSIYTSSLSYMDNDDVEGFTKVINGGITNLKERKEYTKTLKKFFGYSKDCK